MEDVYLIFPIWSGYYIAVTTIATPSGEMFHWVELPKILQHA